MSKNDLLIAPWSNLNNIEFYETLSPEYYYAVATQGGLDNYCDVNALLPYISKATSILEIGAGYGRVLKGILKTGYNKSLYAVERSRKACKYLVENFSNAAKIICTDINDFKPEDKFDLILWMWAGLCEFAKDEQLPALSCLLPSLNIGGHIIIDLIPDEDKALNTTNFDLNNRVIETPFGKDYVYIPSKQELVNYQKSLNLKLLEMIIYKTRTDKKRNLYVYSR